MSDNNKPEEIIVKEDETVVVEEGYDVAEGEGNNGIKFTASVEKT